MTTRFACAPYIDVDDVANEGCGCVNFDDADDRLLVAEKIDVASDVLTRLSGMRYYGPCTLTIRPCRDCAWTCGCCSCCWVDAITLPGVVSVTSVKIDGDVVDPDTYRIVNGDQLIRYGAGDRPEPWPECQKLWRPTTEPDTFEIVYVAGLVTSLERAAAVELTCELLKDCKPAQRSRIPGARNMSGSGLQVTIEEAARADDGLLKVQRFMDFWNPTRSAVPSAVFSPDLLGDRTPHSW